MLLFFIITSGICIAEFEKINSDSGSGVCLDKDKFSVSPNQEDWTWAHLISLVRAKTQFLETLQSNSTYFCKTNTKIKCAFKKLKYPANKFDICGESHPQGGGSLQKHDVSFCREE